MNALIEAGPDGGYAMGKVDDLLNLARQNSLWYFLFGTACCAIELMQTGGPRTDADRLGMIFRTSPRQSDVIILAGTITYKMIARIKLLYEQMAEPKYVLSMGSCANNGGLFQESYAVVNGGNLFLPVDVYIPGCPPRPEALIEGLMLIQQKIQQEPFLKMAWHRDPPSKEEKPA